MATELIANSPTPGSVAAITTLAAAITSTAATTLTTSAAAPAALQAPGQFRIVIDSEIMIVTGGASTTTWTVTRGAEGSTAATHANNANVYHFLTAGALANLTAGATYLRFDNSPVPGAAGIVAGSFVVPTGINGFHARLVSGGAGGASGGGSANGQAGGAGGGAGGVTDVWIPVTGTAALVAPGATVYAILRGGGAGGAAPAGTGLAGIAGNPGGDCGLNLHAVVESLPGQYIAYAVGGMGGRAPAANSTTIVNGGAYGWGNNSNVDWPGCGGFSSNTAAGVGGLPVIGGAGGGPASSTHGGGAGGSAQSSLLVGGAAGSSGGSASVDGAAGQAATWPGCGGGGGGGGSTGGIGGAGGAGAGSLIEVWW